MNKEEAKKILEKFTTEHKLFNIKHSDGLEEAIETLLTAYENSKSYNKGTKEALRVAEDLERQANKEAGDWEARYFELEAELEKEKENNKKLQDKCKELIFEKQELTSALLDSTPNDKIKAKIEELDKEYTEILKDYGNIDEDVIFQIENENVRKQLGEILSKIIVLQSLLEKE